MFIFSGLNYEDVTITTSDNIKLHGWLVKMPGPQQYYPTIVYFHENAGSKKIIIELSHQNFLERYWNQNSIFEIYAKILQCEYFIGCLQRI